MNNYHYIISGLPCLSADFSPAQFSYEETVGHILPLLSERDRRAVAWIEQGFIPANLGHHFYRGASKCSIPFIRRWYEFDHNLRNAQVDYLSRKEGFDSERWTDGSFSTEFEDYPQMYRVFEMEDMMERERALDRLRWEKVNELLSFHYFDIDVILGFVIKARIVARWSEMDHEKGVRMFEELVAEVRGTFKGVNYQDNNK